MQSISPILVISASIAAFLGAFMGIIWLEKVTITFVQRMVAATLYLLGALLVAGIV